MDDVDKICMHLLRYTERPCRAQIDDSACWLYVSTRMGMSVNDCRRIWASRFKDKRGRKRGEDVK